MKNTEDANAGSLHGVVRRTVYFTMILHPETGWTRVGKVYSKRDTAKSWLPFVRKAWRGLRGKISQCTLTYRNGLMEEKSRKALDAKYNMDAPNAGTERPEATK